jgi:hypothetical protein
MTFKTFYLTKVLPFHEANPLFKNFRGKPNKSYRNVFGHFYFKHEKWKVETDTEISKLKTAYKLLLEGKEPFIVSKTLRAGNECLILNGETSKVKKLYIYRT